MYSLISYHRVHSGPMFEFPIFRATSIHPCLRISVLQAACVCNTGKWKNRVEQPERMCMGNQQQFPRCSEKCTCSPCAYHERKKQTTKFARYHKIICIRFDSFSLRIGMILSKSMFASPPVFDFVFCAK